MLKSKAASQEAAIAFPDAGALGGPRGFPCCPAELCRTSGSREHQCTALSFRALALRQLREPLEQQHGCPGEGEGGRQALGQVLLISTTSTLKERINTLSIKFTDETQLG